MLMNVKPIETASERINEIRSLTATIVNNEILPHENMLWGQRAGVQYTDADLEEARGLREHIKATVKQAGLWAPHLPEEYGGAGLSFLEHAYMNEVLAYAMGGAAPFGVVAPNSGNQSILVKYGSEEQKTKWLIPLIDGELESGFSMTEPDQAGSDPRSLKTTARLDGDEWVINGHKWFTSNGLSGLLHRDVPNGDLQFDGGQRTDDPDHRSEGHPRRRCSPRDQRLGSR